MRRFAPQLFAQLFCFPLLILLGSNCYAQLPAKTGSGRSDIEYREWALGHVRREINPNPDYQKLLAKRALQEDFRQLQVVNNHLMACVFERSPLTITNKEIRASLGEIGKLAKRLRINLGIPEVRRDKRSNRVDQVTSNITLSPGLLRMDKAVMSFVNNPVFQQPGVFDSELALRAGNDIADVLQLSELLRGLAKDKQVVR